jgi:hypothetical protein
MEKEAQNINIIYPYGELDLLYFYSKVSGKLINFLKDKEIATKILLPKGPFILKRGSNSPKLFIEDFKEVNERMLSFRKHHLDEVKDKLNEKQKIIWRYFVPRKMINFFYACNTENLSEKIERIFIDIDRKNLSSDEAQKVCDGLIKIIKNDKEFKEIANWKKITILWTGSSFHVYILLKKKLGIDFYNKYLSYGKGKEESFLVKWAGQVSEKTGINVNAGHEKTEGEIILDSSNTPPGKLARAPFSLHFKDAKTIDGICVPVSEEQLGDKVLVKKLRELTPEKVLKNLDEYSKLL